MRNSVFPVQHSLYILNWWRTHSW